LDIEEAWRRYREPMERAMAAFSRDEEAARDGVSQAFSRSLVNKLELQAMFSSLSPKSGDVEVADPRQSDIAGNVALYNLLSCLPEALRVPVA